MAHTLNIAHRGANSLAPENTLAAFRKAVELGSDGFELDVQFSKDGKLVVIHDEKVDRTTNGKGLVKDLTLAELKELDAGSWFGPEFLKEKIPTLDEVLGEFHGADLHINIEIKSGIVLYPGIEKAVLAQVKERRREDSVLISSFNHYSLADCHKLNPEVRIGILYVAGLYEPWNYARALGCYSVHPLFYGIQAEIIQGCKKEGLAIYAWTVNDPPYMAALARGGVDAIITDRPQDLKTVLEEGHR